jgi:hypothetical protein
LLNLPVVEKIVPGTMVMLAASGVFPPISITSG